MAFVSRRRRRSSDVASEPPKRSWCGPDASAARSTKGTAMPDLRPDPLDALLSPITPVAPDPTFAAHLRQRLEHEVLATQTKGQLMHTELTNRPRNGLHHGDVSYITLGLPDLERGKAFYGAVLGWRFRPGNSDHGAQVDDIVPMVGLWAGEQPDGDRVHGAVLG